MFESDTMSWNRLNLTGIAQEFITISKITLEHAARKLGINYESVKNMPNAARIVHEFTETRDKSPRFARFSLTIVIKKGPYMLRGISSKMNNPRKAAVKLILQLKC